MKRVGEVWCPEMLVGHSHLTGKIAGGPASYIRRADLLYQRMRGFMDKRADALQQRASYRSCVQAGGHIGILSRLLAQMFDRVHTFEPAPDNFECLVLNVPQNVIARQSFVGRDNAPRHLRRHRKTTGGHQTGEIGGDTITVRIDDLMLNDCDAICLDLEGYEWDALHGAMTTIARCRPLLVLEENKQGLKYGRKPGDLLALLHGTYRQIDKVDEDIVLCPKS